MKLPLVRRKTAAKVAREAFKEGGRRADENAERLADGCNRAEATIRAVWAIHGTPKPRGLHADSWHDALDPWTCTGCRQPWPCDTAQAVIGRGPLKPLMVAEKPRPSIWPTSAA